MNNALGVPEWKEDQYIDFVINSCNRQCSQCDQVAFENYMQSANLGFSVAQINSYWDESERCGDCTSDKEHSASVRRFKDADLVWQYKMVRTCISTEDFESDKKDGASAGWG